MARIPTAALVAVVVLAAVLPFLNCLGHDFITWDDNIIILSQPFLRGLSLENLWNIVSPVPAREEWLPVRDLTLALNFEVFGDNPGWFAAGNIVLHACAAVSVLFLLARLLGGRGPAFLGALLFACHAAHVESVTWLSGRKDPLSTIFLVLALIGYIRYREGESSLAPAFAAFVLALLSKANGFVFPVWLVAYDLLYKRELKWQRRLLPVLPFAGLAIAHMAIYLEQTSLDGVIEPYPEGGLLTVLLTDVVLLKNYILDLLLPLRHQAIYEVTFMRTPWNMEFLLSAGLLTGLGFLGCKWRRRSWVPFALLLFLANLLPYMNIVPHGIYYAERYLYLPTLSYAMVGGMLLALAFEKTALSERSREPAVALAGGTAAGVPASLATGSSLEPASRPVRLALGGALAVCLVAHFALTWSRNTVWADSVTFWRYQASVLPGNPAPLMNLGETLEIFGVDEDAEEVYEQVKSRDGQVLPEAIYRLARIARRKDDLEKAAALYTEYAKLAPADPRALNNLAEVRMAQKRNDDAVTLYERITREHPRYLLSRANLARLLESLGRRDEACRHWRFIVDHADMMPQRELVLEAEARLRDGVEAPGPAPEPTAAPEDSPKPAPTPPPQG